MQRPPGRRSFYVDVIWLVGWKWILVAGFAGFSILQSYRDEWLSEEAARALKMPAIIEKLAFGWEIWALFALGLVCLLLLEAAYRVSKRMVDAAKSVSLQDAYLFSVPNVRAADCPACKQILSGSGSLSESQLVALLRQGTMKAWARDMRPGDRLLREVPPDVWGRAVIFLAPAPPGRADMIDQTFVRINEFSKSEFCDVHFNDRQLLAAWPSMKFEKTTVSK